MSRILTLVVLLCATACSLFASDIPIAFVSWDVNFPANSGQFDITNMSGSNASVFPDTTFPVTTTVSLSSLSLTVHFNDGSTTVFGSSYFTPAGTSFDGSPIPIGGTNPIPTSATLTGMFSPTSVTLNDGSPATINPNFTSLITDTPTLVDGDAGIIAASTGSTVPEPSSWVILGGGMAILWFLRRKLWGLPARRVLGQPLARLGAVLLVVGCLGASQAAHATVKLNTLTTPSSGVAGVNNVNITGSGFPSGTITPSDVTVTWANTCGGAVVTTNAANSVKVILGTVDRVNVTIPGSLATGTYFVSVSDSTTGQAFTSGNCSQVSVTHTNATLSACLPTSSLGVLAPTNPGTVTAYVPNGCWECGGTGLQVVNVEGTLSTPASISTPNVVNSCSANPATGQAVCVANNTDVYLIKGTTLTNTLTSGSSGSAFFSGGNCENCGVAINALTNKAVINMGLSSSPSGDGIQFLDLNTNTFETPIPLQTRVSEDISVDPTRNLILSPNEFRVYDLLQIQSDGSTVKEFENTPGMTGEPDSAAEDCSTGIALSAEEFSPNDVFITDLTQATLVAGSPAGSWSAPHTNFTMVTNYSFSAGTSGIAAASGSSHLAVVTGEFGGNTFAVLQLPSTSGSGTPTILDYAVAQIPDSTTCGTFSSGLDPHTVTAYTSPNDGKAYALFANDGASCLARIDLGAVLAATRGGTGCNFGACQANDVSSTNFPTGAATFYSTH